MAHPRDTLNEPRRPSGPDRSTLRSPTRFLATAVALLAMACAGDSSVDPVEVRNLTLALEPTKLFLAEGQNGQLHAKLIDDTGNPVPTKDLSWTTSDPQVATVTDAGVVTGLASGVVSITASAKGKKKDANVNVRGKGKLEIHLSSGSGQSGPVGETLDQALIVEVRDRTGAGVPGVEVDWQATGGDGSPSAPTTTTNQNGLTQVLWTLGPSLGDQTLQAKVNGAGTVDFPATGTPGAPASVTVSPADVSMDVGTKQQFSAVVADQFGHPVEAGSIIWVSTAGDILYVDDTGVATGMSPGSAVIEAYAETVSGDANVDVTDVETAPEVSTVAVSPEAHTFTALGQTLQLEAVAFDGADEPLPGINFNWSSSDPSIATVDDMGLVLAKAVGTVSMIVSAVCCDGATDTTSLAITQVPAAVEVSPVTFVLTVDQTATLTAEVRDAEGNPMVYAPSWTSSDSLVATVDEQGLVTALTAGLVTIQAQAGDASGATHGEIADADVEVQPVPAAIEVSPASFSLDVGQSQQLSATVLGSDGAVMEGEEVTWSSTTPTVASITTGGLVSALAEGSAQFEARLASSSSSASSSNDASAEVQSGPSAWSSASSTSELVGVSSGTVQATEDDGGDGGGSDGAFFYDGFESADMLTNTGGFDWGSNNRTSVVRDDGCAVYNNKTIMNCDQEFSDTWENGPASSGNHALRFRYSAGDAMAEQRLSVGSARSELWASWWLRVPVNFEHTSGNNKLFMFWMDAYSAGGDGSTVGMEFRPDGSGGSYFYGKVSSGRQTVLGGDQGAHPFITYPDDQGRWMQIVVRMKAESSEDAGDGIVEVWRRWEGESTYVQTHDLSGQPIRVPASGPDGFSAGYLMGWANGAYSVDTEFLLDDFRLSSTSLLEGG